MTTDPLGTIAFVDVGQGDCTVAVDFQSRAAVLIDCRAGRSAQVAAYLTELGANGVSVALVSHSDWDHIGGVFETLSRFPVDSVFLNLDTKMDSSSEAQTKLRAAQRSIAGLQDRGVSVKPAYAGDAGQVGEIDWEVLAPTHPYLLESQADRDRNTASVVVRMECGNSSFLIAGDADGDSWHEILRQGRNTKADFFRLPHHGATLDGAASLDDVLDSVDADHHIISVGSVNTYGHPTRSTLEALRARADRARVMCTQVNSICRAGASVDPEEAARRLPELSVAHRREDRRACPCAGTVVVRVMKEGVEVVPSVDEHGTVIDKLNNPMCVA